MLPENPCKQALLAVHATVLHTCMHAKKEGTERKSKQRSGDASSRQRDHSSERENIHPHTAHHCSSPALLAAAATAAAGAAACRTAAGRAVASARRRHLACCLQIRSETRQLVVQRLLLLSQHLLQFRWGGTPARSVSSCK